MTPENIKTKVEAIASRRSVLAKLLEKDNLGNLSIDVTQALEEIDDLIAEFKVAFPDCTIVGDVSPTSAGINID
ncbi:hypothetical protein Pse7367_0258 [Thalassoporum mexicanum PCC 7367]|uniref:hypothetical protein n=1 Tax=Thalassoporum mexicanum TaxID=3457544 RepID=UPI00029FEE10|nr:hypothetical protein [Pseudanabaena sp. PCC 7367]AFY68574.1 hypothetical protein Pse7367_0258 [Pseudanabaena sp. PCC 7367]